MGGYDKKLVTILTLWSLIGSTLAAQSTQSSSSCLPPVVLQQTEHCCHQCLGCFDANNPSTCGQGNGSGEGAGEGECCACFFCKAPSTGGTIISRSSFVFQMGGGSEFVLVKDEDVLSLTPEPETPPPRR